MSSRHLPIRFAASTPQAAGASDALSPQDWNLTPWLWPTSDWRDFSKYGSIALPAAATPTVIVQFQVPQGRNGILAGIGIDYTANGGAPFVPNLTPYELTFNLLLNGQPFPGDWSSFSFLPGSVAVPDVLSGLKIRENQTVALQVTNNTLAVTTQFIGARLKGWFYGKKFEPQIMGSQ